MPFEAAQKIKKKKKYYPTVTSAKACRERGYALQREERERAKMDTKKTKIPNTEKQITADERKPVKKLSASEIVADRQMTDEYTRKYGKNGLSPNGQRIKTGIDKMCGIAKVDRGRNRI